MWKQLSAIEYQLGTGDLSIPSCFVKHSRELNNFASMSLQSLIVLGNNAFLTVMSVNNWSGPYTMTDVFVTLACQNALAPFLNFSDP